MFQFLQDCSTQNHSGFEKGHARIEKLGPP